MKRYISELTMLADKKLFICGVTRREAAQSVGITYQYLNNILTSKALPSVGISEGLAKVLDERPEKLRKLMLKCYERRKAEQMQKAG